MIKTPIILGLDEQTKIRLKEVFVGRICKRCGEQAERMTFSERERETYYCYECYPQIPATPLTYKQRKLPKFSKKTTSGRDG